MSSYRISRISKQGRPYLQVSLNAGLYECPASDLSSPATCRVCGLKIVALYRTTDNQQCAINWLDLNRDTVRIHVTDLIHRQAKARAGKGDSNALGYK